jgi:hypothetical protein
MLFCFITLQNGSITINRPLWSYGSWIYNYLRNQCLSPLTSWIWILLRRGVLDTTLCDKVSQWRAAGQWFSLGTPVSSTNKTDCYNITEILLKVALNTITLTPLPYYYRHNTILLLHISSHTFHFEVVQW